MIKGGVKMIGNKYIETRLKKNIKVGKYEFVHRHMGRSGDIEVYLWDNVTDRQAVKTYFRCANYIPAYIAACRDYWHDFIKGEVK